MNESKGVIDAQVEALLQLVHNYHESRCRQIIEHAKAQAANIVKQAHHDARARMHTAIKEERMRAQEKIASTRAQLQTRRRQRHQQADMALLEKAWEMLHERLLTRWQDADSRRIWIRTLVQQALSVLPGKRWQIEHPSGWRPQEALALDNEITAHTEGESPTFVEARDITAGLRICAEGARLDGTLVGLLASRADIEAQLLAEFRRFLTEGLATRDATRKRRKADS